MARTKGSRNRVGPAGARSQAWQAMRVMRRFTTADILTTSEIEKSNLDVYMRGLYRTGYLLLVQERFNGRPGSRNVWQLVRDTGPAAPFYRRYDGSMLDANTGFVYDRHGRVIEQPDPPEPGRRAARKGGAA